MLSLRWYLGWLEVCMLDLRFELCEILLQQEVQLLEVAKPPVNLPQLLLSLKVLYNDLELYESAHCFDIAWYRYLKRRLHSSPAIGLSQSERLHLNFISVMLHVVINELEFQGLESVVLRFAVLLRFIILFLDFLIDLVDGVVRKTPVVSA